MRLEERGLRTEDGSTVRSPASLLRTPPLGPSNGKDTNLLYAVVVKLSPRTREPKFPAFPGERVHLPRPTSPIGHLYHLRTTTQQFRFDSPQPLDFDDIADGHPSRDSAEPNYRFMWSSLPTVDQATTATISSTTDRGISRLETPFLTQETFGRIWSRPC